MKIINKKIVLLFSVILLLSIAAFSTITLLFADEENSLEENNVKVAAATFQEGMSIIDYIIENSHDTDVDADPVYHVVELYSGSSASALEAMCDSANKTFEQHVFNDHKSSLQTKDYGSSIDYKGFSLADTDDDSLNSGTPDPAKVKRANEVKEAIDKADFLYISEDPSSPWSGTNDIISIAIKDAIDRHISECKPIVFDSHSLTMQDVVNGDKKVKDVGSQYWAVDGTKHATFKWPHDMQISTFMDPAEQSATFSPVNGEDQKNNNVWIPVTRDDPTYNPDEHTPGDPVKKLTDYIGRILIIHNSDGTAGDTHLTDKVKASFSGAYDFTGGTIDPALGFDTTKETLVLDEESDLYKYGYFGRLIRPTAIQFDYLDMNDPDQFKEIAHVDYTKYDFVLVEPSTKDVEVGSTIGTSDNVYQGLINAMTSETHLLYDSELAPYVGGGSSYSELDPNTNISFLYRKVTNGTTDVAKHSFVLITTRTRMEVYAGDTDGKLCKDIARIINSGTFRGIGASNNGDSSNVYTVLEIEPCYPIDTVLATYLNPVKDYQVRNGRTFKKFAETEDLYNNQYKDSYYYIRTDGVLSDTPDEIDFGTGVSLTTLLEDTTSLSAAINSNKNSVQNIKDYYKWRLSKAKVAHATGRSFDQVNVVHMSSTEFACSRKTLLDNYDAIYIGGDHSAIKDIDEWYAKKKNYSCYNMYFHNGDIYKYSDSYNKKVGEYGIFSGNDLTASKLEELMNYAKVSMPIIIDKDVCDAFIVADSPSAYSQTLIDPESNMFKFLKYLIKNEGGTLTAQVGSNTVINFDSTSTYKAKNENGQYGNTKEGFATVFLGSSDPTDAYVASTKGNSTVIGETEFGNALNKQARPLLAVTKKPAAYIEDNESTWIDPDTIGEGLKWTASVSNAATLNLWIDDDSDGKFEKNLEENELVAHTSVAANKPGNLVFPIDSDYYGVIYWKVEAVDENGLSSSTTGCCKIARKDQSKMYVNLLEIMPSCGENKSAIDTSSTGTSREESLRTIFFCTDCQIAKARMRGNVVTPTGMFYQQIWGANTFYEDDIPYVGSVNTVVSKLDQFDTPAVSGADASGSTINKLYKTSTGYINYVGKNNGSHTHDFGIVKYNSKLQIGGTGANNTGTDEILSNWFDVIRDDYDVDVTILYTDEFDSRIEAVNNLYNGKTDDQIDKMINGATNGYSVLSDQYNKLYNGIRAVLNGYVEGYNNNQSFHDTTGATVTCKFDLINQYFSPTATTSFTEAMYNVGIGTDTLNKYANASYEMDKILTTYPFEPDVDEDTKAHFNDVISYCTKSDINRDMRKYYDVFNCFNAGNGNGSSGQPRLSQEYCRQYENWRDANIFKNFFFEVYQRYLWNSSYDVKTRRVDLDKVYSCIAIGAAERFGGNQPDSDLSNNSCDALLDYIDKQGNLILFHDSLNSRTEATKRMTEKLSSAFGQNARHEDEPGKWNTDKYYVSSFGSSTPDLTYRMLTYKSRYADFDKGQFGNDDQRLMYKYTSYTKQTDEIGLNNTRLASPNHHMRNLIASGGEAAGLPTDKAVRNNEGIITMYPFYINRELQIGATAPQGYAVDVEDDDMVVYYSLVGGTQGTNSTLFAADPMDGINNYFLYQYGSITYTGAGHGLLIGFGRENNDERKLFINCIVNAGKKSARGSSLNLYDLDTTNDLVTAGKANKTIIPFSGDEADYYTEIEDISDFKGFDFFASIPGSSQMKSVKIFYDVDHTASPDHTYSYDSAVDKLIVDCSGDNCPHVSKDAYDNIIEDESMDGNMLKSIKAGITDMLLRSDAATPMIALKEDCFDHDTGNQYAYIVVQVETGSGTKSQVSSAVLRIQFKSSLNELN